MAFVTCFIKGSAADCITQKYAATGTTTATVTDEHAGFDLSRNVAFGVWSGAYLGTWQHILFNNLYGVFDRRFRSSRKLAAGAKVLFDNFVHLPLLYFPLYYVSQPVLRGEGLESWHDGWQNYQRHGLETIVSGLSLWIPVSTINFYAVPPPLRVGFMAAVSFGWLTVLSFISNKHDPPEHGDPPEK